MMGDQRQVSKQSGEWFQNARFGMSIHWGFSKVQWRPGLRLLPTAWP